MESEMALFDITVSAKHGEVTLYGLPLGAVGERAAAIAAQLECGFLPEQVGAPPPEPLASAAYTAYATAAGAVVTKVVDETPRTGHLGADLPPEHAVIPRDAAYTEAQFNDPSCCGARNALEPGERCARIRGHTADGMRHAYRPVKKEVSDGAQPIPASDLEASTG
jgi:hypothetical protein